MSVVEESTDRSLSRLSTSVAVYKTIQRIGSDPQSGRSGVSGADTDDASVKWKLSIVGIICICGFFAAILSFYVVPVLLVDVACVLLVLLAPFAGWQKIKLRKLGGMRGQLNNLRSSTNRLTIENRELHVSLNRLTATTTDLKRVEGKLAGIAQRSGTQVDKLVDTVKENGKIQARIKRALRIQVMQNIITSCLQVDRDQNFEVSKSEVQVLEIRLSSISGIIFHKERFEAFLESDEGKLTIADVCKIARHLDDPSIPEEKRLVSYATKSLAKNQQGLFGRLLSPTK